MTRAPAGRTDARWQAVRPAAFFLPGRDPFFLPGRDPRMRASSLSALNCRIEVLELDPSILGGKAPVDPASGAVARRLPRCDLPLQGRPVGQPPVQALL